MRRLNQRTWALVVAVAVILMSVLVILYSKTQNRGESDFFENVSLLRHLKQVDAQWELDVMKSRIGINTHYDPLANSLTVLNRLLGELDATVHTQVHDESTLLLKSDAMLRQSILDKSVLIEDFKSKNSVLRNSLVFLPTAAIDIRQSEVETGSHSQVPFRHVLESVDKLLLSSMLFSQNASEERIMEIQSELDRLHQFIPFLSSDAKEKTEIFEAHVKNILREQMNVNKLLDRITAVQTETHLDEIYSVLDAEQKRVTVQYRKYRGYLIIFSAVLIALLLYVAVRLVRSHAEIVHVNLQLHDSNENLEQRVQERTIELRKAQSELISTARQAGMAEIATNVLHNVGNVLNSVNVSAGVVISRLRASKLQGLERAVNLMREHKEDLDIFLTVDTKGQMLPGYLNQLTEVLLQEQQSLLEELGKLSSSVDHIKEIVATQQTYAGTSSITEPLQICLLVEDALRMSAATLMHHHIDVEKNCTKIPELPLDKARILQILMNLISNAKQAVEGMAGGMPRLCLSVDLVHDQVLRIRVADNGVGIAQEHLTRVFSHGFTTKPDGHGFGLHSAAIAAREMGGTLTAESEGLGSGAIFTLELPVRKNKETK